MARDPASTVMIEKRMLLAVTILVTIGFVAWIIAVSTDYWCVIDSPTGSYLNRSRTYFMRSHAGLWKNCRTEYQNNTNQSGGGWIRYCTYYHLFPTKAELSSNPTIDRNILHYHRTEAAFSIISIVLIIMAGCFSLYTFSEPRYMFKRLAGGLHFFSAAAVIVVIEVFSNSVNYQKLYLPAVHPKNANWYYGYSFMLAWICFIMNVIAGVGFLIGSRKRKGRKAASELHALADEPQILGRG